MKAVRTADLGAIAKTPAPATPKPKAKKPAALRRTFTLEETHDKLINETAASMSQAAGKPVSASEALRALLERAGKALNS